MGRGDGSSVCHWGERYSARGTAACGNETAGKEKAGEDEVAEKDVTVQFKNSVFIGDSITEGFAFNEILPSENAMAGAGATAGYIYEEYMDDLAGKKPDPM